MYFHDYIFHEHTSQVLLVSSIQSHFIALEFHFIISLISDFRLE